MSTDHPSRATDPSTPDPSGPDPSWMETLTEKLATDTEFRELFASHPGRAANSIGVPYEDFQAMLAELRDPGEATLGERAAAVRKMSTYGTIMGGLKGLLGSDNTCACDYTPGTWADYCYETT